MKAKSSSKFLCGLIVLFAIIAIFVEYAPAFSEKEITVLGNVFNAMFGSSSSSLKTIWPLVLAFVALLAGMLLALIGLLLEGKSLSFVYLACGVLFVAAGVLYLFTEKFYVAANGTDSIRTVTGLGSGTITTAVFAFLAGVSGFGGFLLSRQK
jgi:hypothetical protein